MRALLHKPGQNSPNSFPLTILDLPCTRESGSQGAGPGNVPWPTQLYESPETPPSPLPPLHFCFIYEYVARIPMSYLFCGPVIFPPRPCCRLTQGPVATVRRKEQSERILFNFFFLCFTHFSLCLPQASSPLLGSLPPQPPDSPLPLYVTRLLKLKIRRVL